MEVVVDVVVIVIEALIVWVPGVSVVILVVSTGMVIVLVVATLLIEMQVTAVG